MIGKTVVFILLISFLHIVSSFPTSLGDNFKCKSRNGKFPKPGSFCRSYYVCANWSPKEVVCPEDRNFFPAKGYCVSAEDYPCLEKPQSKECPLPDGKFLKPGTKCKVYYDCCKGRPTEKKCAKGTFFDHIRGKCDWPQYVTCPDKPKSKKCPRLYGKFLKPRNGCKKFYECRDGVPMQRECPAGQLFDPDRELCEWRKIYTCVEEPKSKKCPRLNGKFLKPRNGCKKFYECRDGVPMQRKCPSGQLFDPDRELCEWQKIYTCVEDVSTTKSTSHSTSTLISTSKKGKVTTSSISPKIFTDSDEDSSSSEENSSEENRHSSTRSETISTSALSSTFSIEYTESTEGEVLISSTQSPPTVETSSTAVSNTEDPDDMSTVSETSEASFTDEYVTKTATYPEVVTEETHPEVTHTEVVKRETSEVTYTEFITQETPSEVTHTEVVTKETHPEVITDETHTATYTIDGRDDFSSTFTPGLTDSVTTHIFCPKPNGYFPHPYDKHKFIACSRGIPTVMNCPEDLVYDHERKSCEYNIKKRKIN